MPVTDHLSKMVMQRKRLGRDLCAAIRTRRATFAERLRERFDEHLEDGETMPDVDLLAQLLERTLASRMERLDEAEAAHFDELLEAQRLRRLRDEAAAELYRPLVEVRRAAVGIYGAELAGEVLSIRGRTQRSPWELAEQAGLAVFRLSRQVGRMPPAKRGGVKVDAEDWLAILRPPLDGLKAILEVADPQKLAAAGTREGKRQAIADFDDAFDVTLRSYLTLVELAEGRAEAERQRRTFRPPHRFRHPQPIAENAAAGGWRGPGWLAGLRARLSHRWRAARRCR